MSRNDSLPRTYSPFREHDGESIVLGWRTPSDQMTGMGFGQPQEEADQKPVEPVEVPGDGHIMTIAPTGSGKGTSCIIPTLLTYTGSVIVIDPKGENAAVTAERRREMGQQVHVIDPFGVSGETPSRFNPLDIVDPKFADSTDVAAMIADLNVPVSERDPYWSNRAKQLITGLILQACHDMPSTERNLISVRRQLAELGMSKAGWQPLEESCHPEARLTHASCARLPERTMQCIVSVAADAVDVFRGESMMDSLYASSFDINAITRGEPMTIYFVLPPYLLRSHAPLLRLWIGAVFLLICRRRQLPEQQTLFLIDEAAQLGTFEPLRVALTLLRGYGVRTWSFWQDVAQIRQLYSDWETLMGNCQAIQVFGRMGARAAKAAADALGCDHPGLFRDLQDDQMIVAMGGADPILCRRTSYLGDRILAPLAGENPFFGDELPGETRRPSSSCIPRERDDRQNVLFPLEPFESRPPRREREFDWLTQRRRRRAG